MKQRSINFWKKEFARHGFLYMPISGGADNVAITAGSGTTIGADEVVDGSLGTVKIQYVKIMDGTLDGTAKATVNSNGLKVDGSAVTQPVSAASLPLPTGASTSAKQPALGTAGSASSDVITVQGIASMTALKVDGSAVTQPVSMATNTPVGNVAHDSADSGAPIKVGGRARSSEIAPVASDDRTDFVADLAGKQIVLPYANPENFVKGVTSAITDTTSTSVVSAPGSGLRNYITQITIGNSHATVGTFVNIQDGNGGTTLYTIPAAAVYGGATITFPTPLRQPTTNTAIYCACVTTGANVIVSISGYKGA